MTVLRTRHRTLFSVIRGYKLFDKGIKGYPQLEMLGSLRHAARSLRSPMPIAVWMKIGCIIWSSYSFRIITSGWEDIIFSLQRTRLWLRWYWFRPEGPPT